MGNRLTCIKSNKKPKEKRNTGKSKKNGKEKNQKNDHPIKEIFDEWENKPQSDDYEAKKQKYLSTSFITYDLFKKHVLAISNSDLSKGQGKSKLTISKPVLDKDHYYVVAEGSFE